MNFRELSIQLRYRSELHDFPRDFLIPVLARTKVYKRGTGYFSTSSLVELSTGLFEMARNGGKIQVVCSPYLSTEDIEAINLGYKKREEVIVNTLCQAVIDPVDKVEEDRLNLVANLIANETLDIKVAFMENSNGIVLYHEKIAVFEDSEGNKISYAGSPNESQNGLDGNFESLYTFCSWKDNSQQEGVILAENDFDNLWNNRTFKLHVIPFPEIVVNKLLKYKKNTIDWETDEKQYGYKAYLKSNLKFHKPDGVTMLDYQDKAVAAWFENQCTGIFDMCTGSGKTYTALWGAVQFAEKHDENIAVFIVCPYIHLVSQWEEDVNKWCNVPIIIAHSKSPNLNWKEDLLKAYKRFRNKQSPFVCITTNDTFAGDEIQKYITRFTDKQNVLLIVDEAHNFGAKQMVRVMPWNIRYRMALSATIKRHMDKTGTNCINEYFGKKCITYDLERAINEKTLVHYVYYPVLVYLSQDELVEYGRLSKKLKQYVIVKNGKAKISEAGKSVIYQRARLLAGAKDKTSKLMEMMEPHKMEKNILIYCGATSVEDEDTGLEQRQIDLVTSELQTEYGMSVKRFTAEEGLKERENIKEYFSQGMYQAVTAIKCLDEGVNIPGIKTALILSSSRNPKEFVQRRGRLLRKSDGKKRAYIYDFITLPRDLDDVLPGNLEEDRSIIVGEISRMEEFGQLADNAEVASDMINRIMTAYDYFFDVKEEDERMEEYYAE